MRQLCCLHDQYIHTVHPYTLPHVVASKKLMRRRLMEVPTAASMNAHTLRYDSTDQGRKPTMQTTGSYNIPGSASTHETGGTKTLFKQNIDMKPHTNSLQNPVTAADRRSNAKLVSEREAFHSPFYIPCLLKHSRLNRYSQTFVCITQLRIPSISSYSELQDEHDLRGLRKESLQGNVGIVSVCLYILCAIRNVQGNDAHQSATHDSKPRAYHRRPQPTSCVACHPKQQQSEGD